MTRRQVGNLSLAMEWLASTQGPDRREGLLAWLQAVAWDPELVTSGIWAVGNRMVRISHVPSARTCVSFVVFDTPARVVHLLGIDDDAYEPPADWP